MNTTKIQNVYTSLTSQPLSNCQTVARAIFTAAVCIILPFTSLKSAGGDSNSMVASKTTEGASKLRDKSKAHAELVAGTKKVHIVFTQKPKTRILAAISAEGFTEKELQGLHIHESGNCEAPDYKSAGGHFNPTAKLHGSPSKMVHAGDLGNISADKSGIYSHKVTLHNVTLEGENAIVGKAVILHAKADDFTTQPSGNSGDRVGCAVIEMDK